MRKLRLEALGVAVHQCGEDVLMLGDGLIPALAVDVRLIAHAAHLVVEVAVGLREHGIARQIDDAEVLGIATEGGLPNEGLMAYKRNLGFDVSPKYTLQKEIGL